MALNGKIYGGIFLLWGTLLLTACSAEQSGQKAECFFKASLTKANYSAENFDFSSEIGNQIAYAYADGEIAYFPFDTGFSFYFGGTCDQAARWKRKIGGRLKITDISKETYWADYKAHHEFDGIIPFEEPEDK